MPRLVPLRPTLAAAAAILALTAASQPPSADTLVPDEEAGAEIYNNVCKGCHGVSIAPSLRGIIDRPIASVASFAGYSEGLKTKQSMKWTAENLSAFLTAPTAFAPGTLMTQTVTDAQQRANLIAYLATLPPPRQ